MPNPYVNKVVRSNGTTLIDISDTSAVAADVASGKYFYLASGEKVEGTASGGSGNAYTRTVVCPQQTVTPASDGNGTYYAATLTGATALVDGDDYIVTFDDTEWYFTCCNLWNTYNLLGDQNYMWDNVDQPYPFCIIWESGTTYTLVVNSATSRTVKVEKIVLSGSPMNLTTKTITQNGTYDAEDDSADGYSSVTVNVSGGNGLEYETGTYTAAADGNPSISFANTHSAAPAIIVFMDVSTSYIGTTAGTQYGFFDYVKLFGTKLKTSNTLQRDGAYQWARVGSSGSTTLGSAILPDTTTQVTSSGFTPNFNSNSYKCKSGQTYKWIAIWK